MRYYYPLAWLALLVATGCQKNEQILCGDPAVGLSITYQVVDAATGQDWYAGPGRPSGDSLRLLGSRWIAAVPGRRAGNQVLLGPLLVNDAEHPIVNNQRTVTQYLGLGSGDVDTVQIVLHYYPAPQPDPCGFGPGIDEVTIVYNGRPNNVFRTSFPADSLDGHVLNKVVRLLKR